MFRLQHKIEFGNTATFAIRRICKFYGNSHKCCTAGNFVTGSKLHSSTFTKFHQSSIILCKIFLRLPKTYPYIIYDTLSNLYVRQMRNTQQLVQPAHILICHHREYTAYRLIYFPFITPLSCKFIYNILHFLPDPALRYYVTAAHKKIC